jgi:hypothetical protein
MSSTESSLGWQCKCPFALSCIAVKPVDEFQEKSLAGGYWEFSEGQNGLPKKAKRQKRSYPAQILNLSSFVNSL